MQNPFEEILLELKELKEKVLSLHLTTPEPIEIISRPELIKRLNITESTAITWGRKHKIPEMRIGSAVRYNWPEVVKALENKKIKNG